MRPKGGRPVIPGEIKVLRDGLLIGGHRYAAGDVVRREHHTHDVVEAADGRGGQLTTWVLRDRANESSSEASDLPPGIALEAVSEEDEGAPSEA